MSKKYIIVHPTLQRAKWNWERLQKWKWFFPKAQNTCNNTCLKLWDILGNEYFFAVQNHDYIDSCRGYRASDIIWIDDFPPYPKNIVDKI